MTTRNEATSGRLVPDLVPDLVAARAAEAPDGVALRVDQGGELTFAGWLADAQAVASGLVRRGVRPGDRVALLFDEQDWIGCAVGFVGTLLAGAVAMPLSGRLTDPEAEHALRQAACVGLLFGRHRRPATIDGWRVEVAELAEGPVDGPPRVSRSPEDLAQILYTSGATGAPALIGASHRNVLAGWTPARTLPHQPGRFFVHALPIGTNAGQVALLHPVQDPHTAVLLPVFDAARYTATVRDLAADHTLLVPATAAWLLRSDPDPADLDSVRTVALTAARTSAEVLAGLAGLFRSATVTNNYTTTEAWPAMTSMVYDPAHPDALGRPLAGQRLAVLDPAGQPLPDGQVGEIALAAAEDIPSRDYVGTPPAGRSAFDGGWVRTGDLGFLDAAGLVHLVDRKADLIVTGGFNVSSQEVEAALEQHPEVREVAVLGMPHPVLGNSVVAVVVGSRQVPVAELRTWAADRLADYKLPTAVIGVEALPRTALGKIRKDALRQVVASAVDTQRSDQGIAPPSDPDQATLLELWREVLGNPAIGPTDDFLAVGGHSLAAFEIAERAGRLLGFAVPRTLILAEPTVAAQAAAIVAVRAAAGAGVGESGGAMDDRPIRPRSRRSAR